MTLGRRAGIFGPSAMLTDARRWFADAGLTINGLEQSGARTSMMTCLFNGALSRFLG
jgi:hypothetical protein